MKGHFVCSSPASRFQAQRSWIDSKGIYLEWGRLIGLVKGALAVAGDVQAGFRLVIKAPAILFYQSPLAVSLLQGDLKQRWIWETKAYNRHVQICSPWDCTGRKKVGHLLSDSQPTTKVHKVHYEESDSSARGQALRIKESVTVTAK